MTHWSLLGRRVLAVGPGLAPLARGPLFGAALESAGLERLAEARRASVDLALVDVDAHEPQALTAALDAPEDVLERMQGVVADHLNRFAFREGELDFRWERLDAAA